MTFTSAHTLCVFLQCLKVSENHKYNNTFKSVIHVSAINRHIHGVWRQFDIVYDREFRESKRIWRKNYKMAFHHQPYIKKPISKQYLACLWESILSLSIKGSVYDFASFINRFKVRNLSLRTEARYLNSKFNSFMNTQYYVVNVIVLHASLWICLKVDLSLKWTLV